MTTLNFALSRAASRDGGRATRSSARSSTTTATSRRGSSSPTTGPQRAASRSVDDECRLDLDHLRSLVSERTRVVAFPWAANAVGTVTPVAEIAAIAHDAGALAWVDAVHYGPHGPIDVAGGGRGRPALLAVQVLRPAPRARVRAARAARVVAAVQGAARADLFPVGNRYETGTLAHELLAGFVAAVEYLDDVGWEFVTEHEHDLGQRFLDGLPDGWTLHGIPTMDGRVPTFAITHAGSRRRKPRPASASAASPSGTATTTPSRS